MSCAAWTEQIIDLLAGELPEDEALRLEQHLAECDQCRSDLDEMEARLEAMRAALQAEPESAPWTPDPAAADRIYRAFAEASAGSAQSLSPSAQSPSRSTLNHSRSAIPSRSPQKPSRSTQKPSRSARNLILAWLDRPFPIYGAGILAVAALLVGLLLGREAFLLGPRGGAISVSPERSATRSLDREAPSRPWAPGFVVANSDAIGSGVDWAFSRTSADRTAEGTR